MCMFNMSGGDMETKVKSTDARNNLKALLSQVWETEEPVEILLDGKPVAVLTLEEPQTGTPALRIKFDEARKGWSELLNYVFIMGARFYFRVRLNDDKPAPKIYLVRPVGSRNRFDEAWKAHRETYRAQQNKSLDPVDLLDHIEDLYGELQEDVQSSLAEMQATLEKSVQQINNKIGVAFASTHRPHLYAVPELGAVPLRSARDIADDGVPD